VDDKGVVPVSKPIETSDIIEIWNLAGRESPYTVCYDLDWPERFLECWKLKKLQ